MAADADEIQALKDSDLSAAIVLGFNPMEPGVEGKINMWETVKRTRQRSPRNSRRNVE